MAVAIAGVLSAIATVSFHKISTKSREAEAYQKITEYVTKAKSAFLEGDFLEPEAHVTPYWGYSLEFVHGKKAIATATPRDGEGRSLTVLITPEVLRFCWGDLVDVPSCEVSSAGL
jgi:hypothetical protein